MKSTDERAAHDRAAAVQDAMPQSDPAYEILAAILDVVPASRWTFARIGPKGELDSLYGSHGSGVGLAGLAEEFKLQRSHFPSGPRIAATLGSLENFASGITLVFADDRSNFGILTLLRTFEAGPFTSIEISMLTFALDAFSDRLAALRMHAPDHPLASSDSADSTTFDDDSDGEFYVLDSDLQIVLAWNSEDRRRIALTGLRTRIAERLPLLLEQTVRELTTAWHDESDCVPGIAHPVPFLVVRTQPMSGPPGLFIGVHVDRYQPPNSLTGAAARFHITPREVQVLALLLDGNHLDEIAQRLYITSSTVQDHIKSMLDKTDSRNRSELIARVLGWESSPITHATS